jgi:putative ABC transport system permease protein
VLSRTLSLVLTRFIAAPLPHVRGEAGELARQNAMRNPKRTAASAAALHIGVAVVGSITIMASSWKASINRTIDQAFLGEYIINSGAGLLGGVDPSLTDKLNALPEVEAATGVRTGFALINGSVQQVLGVDPTTAFKLFDVKPLQGDVDSIAAPGTIAVYESVAKDKNLKMGDSVAVLFKDTGQQTLRVAMIYGTNRPAGNYVVGRPTYEQNFTNRYDTQVFVKKAANVTPEAGLAAVTEVAKPYAGTKVMDQTAFKADVGRQINQLLSMVYALLFLAIVIALLGIANTLALSIFERTRELGLLRAVGMTRSQLRQTIRWESVIIALEGALLGTVTALFFGWALVQAFSSQIDMVKIPYVSLLVIIALAGVAGVIAAIPPSRRAAKLDVLKAVVTE